MTSRILVVDPVPTNRIILRVKLASAYYKVLQAGSGAAALEMIKTTQPDLVITASTLPDMSGIDLCSAVRDTDFAPPVVVIRDGLCPADKLEALNAGADDVLDRPLDELVLLARLRSLLRARDAEAELRLREDTRRALGLAEQQGSYATPGKVRIVSARPQKGLHRLVDHLAAQSEDRFETIEPEEALRKSGRAPDVIVILEAPGDSPTGLALLPQFRAHRATRHSALIYVAHPAQRREAASALDMGANDLMISGFDAEELALRIAKQMERKKLGDRLRANMRDGLRAAVIDPLTGLYNRRYAIPHADKLANRAKLRRKPYALLLLDLDFFKQINDDYGHSAGDSVLVMLSQRLRDNLRAADLIARWGGEEFLVAMPDTDRGAAMATAERLRRLMEEQPVTLPSNRNLTVTLSIGVAVSSADQPETPDELIQRADRALYAAKDKGRNTLVMADTVLPFAPQPKRRTTAPRRTVAKDPAQLRLRGL